MTSQATPDTQAVPRGHAKWPAVALEEFVVSKVGPLQAGYLASPPASTAVATLARLRRAIAATPGSDPRVWQTTLGGMPEVLIGRKDTPSRAEWAVHAAITLFAIHQQSRRLRMHQPGISIGRAVRRLAPPGSENEAALQRRFHALGTADTFTEVLHHARGLITQLRAADIPLDYGRFAVDLLRLQDPARANGVRLAWGRDYYRVIRPDLSYPDPADTPTPGEPA